MSERAKPPPEITPREFFTRWAPEQVAADEERRRRLGDSEATLEFEITGEGGGFYTVRMGRGAVHGVEGRAEPADLRVRVDIDTWRELNAGTLSAPEALLRRRLHCHGNWLLAIKLHLILG
jgi:putative sterol carrier protein